MTIARRKQIENGNVGGNADFKVQLASDASGQYVDVVALDSGITIGSVALSNVEAGLTAGTAPAKMIVGGVVFNSAAPTVTNGQTIALQGDSQGRLEVSTPGIITQRLTPTVTAGVYAAGTVLGGLLTFNTVFRVGQTSGLIQKVIVTFVDGLTPTLDMVFFNANPTGSTTTDNVAIAIVAADLPKIIGVAHINDFTVYGTPSVGQAQNLAISFANASSQTLYAAIVARSSFTPGTTSDVGVALSVIPD